MSGIREQQRAFTRERLLSGSVEVFEAKGYAAATVDDIVAAVGASRATFYLHFKTKSDVVAELARQLAPEVEAFYLVLDDVLEDGSREALRDWFQRGVLWVQEKHPALLAIQAARVKQAPGSLVQSLNYADHMPHYLERWSPDHRDEARVRIALLAAHFSAMYSYSSTPGLHDRVSTDLLVEGMTSVWHGVLTSVGPA